MNDEYALPVKRTWIVPATMAVALLVVGSAVSISFNGFDVVKLVAGLVTLPLALVAAVLALRRPRRWHGAGLGALLGVAGLGLLLTSGFVSVGGILGPSEDDVRERLRTHDHLTDLELTALGEGRFSFTGKRGIEECIGEIALSSTFGGGSGEMRTIACSLPSDLATLERACPSRVDACARGAQLVLDAEGEPDWSRLVPLVRAACEGGRHGWCFELGLAHEHGRGGVTPNHEMALRYYQRACDAGTAGGCHNAGVLLFDPEGSVRDPARAAQRWQRGCELGFQRSCSALGESYLNGEGVEQSFARARELFRGACDGGRDVACAQLAALHSRGEGGPEDLPAAFRLRERACELGHARSCELVADYLLDGTGTARDAPRALGMLAEQCQDGRGSSCATHGMTLHEGAEGVAQDRAAALRSFERACELRNADGCNNAGVYLRDGLSGAADRARGQTLLERACELGHPGACRAAGR